jgi:two-component system, sensor histidine kinase RpfC
MNAVTALKTRTVALPEFEQALLRLVIIGSVLAFVVLTGRRAAANIVLLVGYYAIAVGILAAIWIWPAPSAPRRVVAMIADVAAITVGLFLAVDTGIAVFSAYFLVIIGNGCRYGRGASHVCQSLCLIGFVSVFLYASWWPNNPKVWAGLFVMLLIVPLYVSALFQRMRNAHLKAEQALKECLEREGHSG